MKSMLVIFFALSGFCAMAQNPFAWSGEGVPEEERSLAYIASREPPAHLAHSAWLEQKDRLLRRMTSKSPPIPNLAKRLIAIAEDPTCERTAREYIMQYLQLNLRDRVSASEREEIRNYLRKAAADAGNASAGTAMLVMRLDSGISPAVVENAAVAALRSERVAEESRFVAMQILYEHNPALVTNLIAESATRIQSPLAERLLKTLASDPDCESGVRGQPLKNN